VAQYYRQSKITFAEVEGADWQFDLLLPIKHRIKDIVLLGGEPFYDKRCRTFLQWSLAHGIQAKLTVFTNGSVLDRQFVQDYPGRLVLVFSVDAIDRPAEYIRFGTNWSTVRDNYLWARNLTAVETRVNITTSPYNYPYLYPLLSWLAKDWPTVVSFGPANQSDNSPFMDETVIPLQSRQSIITSLVSLIDLLDTAEIEPMQKANAINAIRTIATNLADGSFDHDKHQHLRDFVQKMDLAKGISLEDYCPEVAEYLDIRPGKLANTSPEFL
jgi:hypothetical protein